MSPCICRKELRHGSSSVLQWPMHSSSGIAMKVLFPIPCRDLIVECLDDRDDSIRLRALDLISGMVTKKNLVEIVKKLMLHMDQSDSTSERLIYMFHANHSNLNSNVVIIRCNGPYAMDITATLMYVYAHSFLTLVIGIYSRGQKKVPFHLRATIVLQYERLRSVLRNHSVLRLLIQQLLLPGVSG